MQIYIFFPGKIFGKEVFLKKKHPIVKNTKFFWKNFLENEFIKKDPYPIEKVQISGKISHTEQSAPYEQKR